MDIENSLTLKLIFGDIKMKFSVPDPTKTIEDLKNIIIEKLQAQGINLQPNQFQCNDSDDFMLNNTDIIGKLLKQNETVKLVQKLSDNIIQQQQQIIEQAPIIEEATPAEAIVVLYDISGSMSSCFFGDKDLSRMGAVNALFSAFADKTLAFEYNHLVKLVCFSSGIYDKCDFTNDFNKFIQLVDGANPGGSTKCYDAIDYAITALLQIKTKYPDIVLRIIALTDGEDNASVSKPNTLVQKIFDNKIIIDSFVVSDACLGLKTLTHASNGRCYCPRDLAQGMQLFEIESILSTSLREKVEPATVVADLDALKDRPFDTEGMKVVTVEVSQKAVMRREDIVKKAQEAAEQAKKAPESAKSSAPGASGGGAHKRILKELNDNISKGKETQIKVFPTADNINLWKILVIGPKGGPYEDGIYQLSCSIPQDYPFKPPKIAFVTKMYHPNVSRSGQVCLDILKDQWSPALTVYTAILSILSMLNNPNPDDSLDSNVAAQYKHDRPLYIETVLKEKAQFASPTLDEILVDVLGNIAPDSQDYIDAKQELTEWIEYTKLCPLVQTTVNPSAGKGKSGAMKSS